jgi:hypothetical protein
MNATGDIVILIKVAVLATTILIGVMLELNCMPLVLTQDVILKLVARRNG